ncbi:hypothetical protein EPD60_02225 [Flaviaesturariibacter flavus]|uniref:Uncharacterized protein n=1 Tax=Flaviaesturariibacter flavus TaxID=2502780 RepID=A0A4R1BPV1_9BACT|nr:hypothetical protein [Flaviaesturariibacter flavus]TCJ19255.1 hypothetical protein EPD60_02225 [Flaviaesturariibacter flavus]
MSLSSTAMQAINETHQSLIHPQTNAPFLAAALVMSVYAAQLSKKQLRRMKRRALWSFFKAKIAGMITGRDSGISTRTLMYILIGLGVLILAFIAPVVAIILLLVGVLILLLNR